MTLLWSGIVGEADVQVAVCVPLNIFVIRDGLGRGQLDVFACDHDGVPEGRVAVLTLPKAYRTWYCGSMAFLGTVLFMHGNDVHGPLLAYDFSDSRWSIVPNSRWIGNFSTSACGRAFAAQEKYGTVHVFDVDDQGKCTETLRLSVQPSYYSTCWLSWDAQLIAVATRVGLDIRWIADGSVMATIRGYGLVWSCAPLPCGGFAVLFCFREPAPMFISCPCNGFKATQCALPLRESSRLQSLSQGALLGMTRYADCATVLEAIALSGHKALAREGAGNLFPQLQLPDIPLRFYDDRSLEFPMVSAVTGKTMMMKPEQHADPIYCRGFTLFRKAWIAACLRAQTRTP